MELQECLSAFGFYRGDANGRLDDDTRAALAEYQTRNGLKPDAFATVAVLERLRQTR